MSLTEMLLDALELDEWCLEPRQRGGTKQRGVLPVGND